MLTLYYSPGACSMAPHIVLEDIGCPYRVEKIDLGKGEQNSDSFTGINPRRKVPVLAIDGEYLTEDIAILLYLAQRFPEKNLSPSEPLLSGRMMEWLSFMASGIHTAYGELLHPERYAADAACAPSIKIRAKERLTAAFADIETRMRFPFLVGDGFTVTDAYLFVFFTWGRRLRLIGSDTTPALQRWGQALAERDSVRRVLSAEGVSVR